MNPFERRQPLSELLRDISDDPDPEVTVGEIVHRLGRRSFGALLFIFSAPNWLPLPPGSSTFLAAPCCCWRRRSPSASAAPGCRGSSTRGG